MRELVCIVCPNGCLLAVDEEHGFAVSGQGCPRGEEYGRGEVRRPMRVVSSTVRIEGAAHRRCPVKIDRPIDKHLAAEAVRALNGVCVAAPVRAGDVVLSGVCGTDAAFIITRGMEKL